MSLKPLIAAEYFVAPQGADNNQGTQEFPFKTIHRAADVMQPGGTCTVRGGIYREWISPPRGGVSGSRRILYRAFPGEEAIIKGSEQVKSLKKSEGRIWAAELPDSFFGSFNPFKTVSEDILLQQRNAAPRQPDRWKVLRQAAIT